MSTRRSERGAVLIEAAIAVLLLGVLVIGTIEYGYAWRQTTALENTVQQAARAGAGQADQPLADYAALQAFRSTFETSDSVALEYIIVYESNTPDGEVPNDSCFTASVAGVCNRYLPTDLLRPDSDFGCGPGSPDRFWCPTARERARTPLPDYVGLHARFQYAGITSLVPGGITIERHAVYATEPCAFGLPGC